MDAGTLTLYTAQAQVVVDAIERDGVSRVKRAYIDAKYGDAAWSFREAYAFYTQHAQKIVPLPEGAESGIWAYCDPAWTGAGTGSWLLELAVPRSQAVLFDLRVWNRILSLEYVGADAADEQRFAEALAAQGMASAAQAFSTSFYPLVKREVQQSWQRLFDSAQGCPETYLEAGLWEIRREWVVRATQV